jgi:hypothetical protein
MKLTPEQRAQKLVPVMREIRLRAYPPKAEPWLPLVIGNKPRPLDVFAMRVNAQAVVEEFDFLHSEIKRLTKVSAETVSVPVEVLQEVHAAHRALLESAGEYVRQSLYSNPEWDSGFKRFDAALAALPSERKLTKASGSK